MPATEEHRYQVQVHKSAVKLLSRLPKDLVRRITTAIDGLAVDPRPPGCKKLAGKYDHYRIRVGDWRITYTIENDLLVVTIIEVAPRGDAYRNL